MKKIIGILGVVMIAATMFFSANGVNSSSSDTSLADLVGMNAANAQSEANMYYVNKSKANKTDTIRVWVKTIAGVEHVYTASVEGGVERTSTISYDCCQSGGHNCSTNLRLC
jgi:hypothetical protein